MGVVQLEDTLEHRYLCGGRAHSAEGTPIVDDHSGTQHLATTVDGASLFKIGQLIIYIYYYIWKQLTTNGTCSNDDSSS